MFASLRLPPAVRRGIPLDRGEKLLAAAETVDGRWVAATSADLVVVGAGDPADGPVLRRPWCDVDRAAFDPHRQTVTVEWVDAADDLRLQLTDPARTNLPAVVRERVLWSVVLAETVDVPGGSARIAVRRRPDGSLFSQAVAGTGVDLARQDVADVVDATESKLRGACGLPV
ncbi:hypothetical protein ACNHYB_01270 [Isoptericola jiangsuensis]|uniref:hypothetical protein n=1 Tax=Isoptericola jiangsuensis TaxID=548579 RepID=UPI003AAF7DC3